jgi:hypothetical protein
MARGLRWATSRLRAVVLFVVLCFALCLGFAQKASAAPRCELGPRAWLEGRVAASSEKPARAVDARRGETLDVFVAVPGKLDGRAVVFGDSGARGRVSWTGAGCPDAAVSWRRVEPRMQHQATPAPNANVALYANAVIFGPKHGTWIGFDHIEYFDSPIAGAGGWTLHVADAAPTETTARKRDAVLLPFGTMRLAAAVAAGSQAAATPGAGDAPGGAIADSVFRYSFRRDDGFVGWLTSFFNVPYVFGSAGKGAKSQAERRVGADCADVLVAALRRTGVRNFEYSSVMYLIDHLPHASAPAEIAACPATGACAAATPPLHFGRDVRPGDFLALDYVGVSELPRPWDHIVAVVEDRGPNGAADGVLGPDDLVADSGDAAGLKFAPLREQGAVRVMVLRPPREP